MKSWKPKPVSFTFVFNRHTRCHSTVSRCRVTWPYDGSSWLANLLAPRCYGLHCTRVKIAEFEFRGHDIWALTRVIQRLALMVAVVRTVSTWRSVCADDWHWNPSLWFNPLVIFPPASAKTETSDKALIHSPTAGLGPFTVKGLTS